MIKRVEPVALLVMVLGALNWGIIGVTDGDTNVLFEIFGSGTLLNVVYVVVGVAGLLYVPKLLDALHLGGGHSAHPRGT
ncbi:MAG: DUF378 domain-containing protein [Solirubrobacterales bacterium]